MHTTHIFAGLLVCGWLFGCGSGDDPDATGSGPANGSGGGTTSAQGGAGPGSGGSSSTGPGGGGAPMYTGYTRADTAGNALDQSADIAVAPDGTIYVSWVAADDVRVARSTDGGASFEAPAQLDGASIVPLVSMARHPRMAADNSRVAVAVGDQQGSAGNLYLFVSSSSGPLSFGQPIAIGTDVSTVFRDFPKPIFLPDGSIAVSWHGWPTAGSRIFLAREDASYASTPVTGGAPGLPCDCCPMELFKTGGGDLMVAYRNNISNLREMWLAQAPQSGTFSSWVQASSTEGTVPTCPMQGPRIAQLGTDHAMVWSTRGSSNTGAALIAMSSNGGASWSGSSPILTGDEPTIAVGASGRAFVTAITGNQRSSMTWSDDGGATWSGAENLAAPDGDLSTPQAMGGAGIAVLAGVSQASTVWLLRME